MKPFSAVIDGRLVVYIAANAAERGCWVLTLMSLRILIVIRDNSPLIR